MNPSINTEPALMNEWIEEVRTPNIATETTTFSVEWEKIMAKKRVIQKKQKWNTHLLNKF